MMKLVGSIATTAAFVAVVMSLWRDYGVLVTLKRAFIAYAAFYVVGAALALVFRNGIEEEWASLDKARRLKQRKQREQQARQSIETNSGP